MKLGRRHFLQIAGATGTAALVALPGRTPAADGIPVAGEDESSVLVDTTKCIGCRGCEAACAEANKLPDPPSDAEAFATRRNTGPDCFTVVLRAEKPDGSPRFVKRQCMHCVEPACASACPVRALDKLETGPVSYDGSKCMGCRYCMVACPFSVPKYQYASALPVVRKCTFCSSRQAQGKPPACTSVCPSGALTYGTRGRLIAEARGRVYGNPDKYTPHIYGEHEAGGTNWLYITDITFEKLGFEVAVNDNSYPRLVRGALGVPPVVMTLWPPLLMGLWAFSHRDGKGNGKGNGKGGDHG
ncbi:MAG: 4Fe-4S dicluster domain-containing protein [Deltaproteobacteria bacterium]